MAHEFTFSLGLSHTNWLADASLFPTGIQLFYSFNTLAQVQTLMPSEYDLRMDSGGYSRLQQDGNWDKWPDNRFMPRVRRIMDGLRRVKAVAIKDWMCEPWVIEGKVQSLKPGKKPKGPAPAEWLRWARDAGPVLEPTVRAAEALGIGRFEVVFHGTGLTVEEHQRRTVESYLQLSKAAPDVPWFPVLQGWTHSEYLRCWDMYHEAGVDLRDFDIVAVGSTCRRHDTEMVEHLAADLKAKGLHNLWMLGMKTDGLRNCVHHVRWADSHAWSYAAFQQHLILPGCQHGKPRFRRKLGREEYGNCANCPRWARTWYEQQEAIIAEALARPPRAMQMDLFRGAA